MYKQKNIIMLATNQDANIGDFIISKHDHSGHLVCGIKKGEPYNMSETRQHLYILSNDPIQVGDTVYSIRGFIGIFGHFENSYENECQKVIASTDNFLYVPRIPNSFVTMYVNSYNKGQQIKNIEVEYNDPVCKCDTIEKGLECIHGVGEECLAPNINNDFYGLFPKLNSDGTINIKYQERKKTKIQLVSGPDRFDCDNPVYMKFGGQYGHMVVMNDIPYFIPQDSDGMDVEDVSEYFDVVKRF